MSEVEEQLDRGCVPPSRCEVEGGGAARVEGSRGEAARCYQVGNDAVAVLLAGYVQDGAVCCLAYDLVGAYLLRRDSLYDTCLVLFREEDVVVRLRSHGGHGLCHR